MLLAADAAQAAVKLMPISGTEAASIEKKIPQPDILKAEFKQSKKLEGIQKLLLSSGRLIYSRSHGIYFELKKPFLVTYIFTKKGLLQIEDGKRELVMAGKQAFFNEFSEILTSIFSGKYEELSKHFQIAFGENGKEWNLMLEPTNSTVNNVVTKITVSGNRYPNDITILEKNGNLTRMQLSAINSLDLTKDEADYFNF